MKASLKRFLSSSKKSTSKNKILRSETPLAERGKPEVVTERLYRYSKEVIVTPPTTYMAKLSTHRCDGYYRENMFGKEFIIGSTKFSFSKSKSKKIRQQLFIFALVKKDALKYIEKKKKIRQANQLPAIKWNEKLKKNHKGLRIAGVDVDGAYWRIAYQMGLITENTFYHGLRINNKMLCLAALAALGRDKTYKKIEEGVFTDKTVIVKGDPRLRAAYNNVRIQCYKYMQEIAAELGSDFICYKTDCIYFVERSGNTAKVRKILDEKLLDYKLVRALKDVEKEKPHD